MSATYVCERFSLHHVGHVLESNFQEAASLSYIASQGNITVTIVCTAISIGITQGISYCRD